jgi:Phage integrase family
LVGGALAAGVGHASTVRPDPSTLGVVGERGSHRESCSQLVSGRLFGLLQNPRDVVGAAVDDRDGHDAGHLIRMLPLGAVHDLRNEAAAGAQGNSALGLVVDLALPAVDGADGREVVPRSAQPISHQTAGELDQPVRIAPRGGPLRESKFVPSRFKPAIGAANEAIADLDPAGRPDPLPEDLRLYDLRHTAASLMIRQGASVKAVQRQLGHATASITLDTYGHLFPDELDALAGRLEDARADALANLARTQRGPAVVPLREGAGQ